MTAKEPGPIFNFGRTATQSILWLDWQPMGENTDSRTTSPLNWSSFFQKNDGYFGWNCTAAAALQSFLIVSCFSRWAKTLPPEMNWDVLCLKCWRWCCFGTFGSCCRWWWSDGSAVDVYCDLDGYYARISVCSFVSNAHTHTLSRIVLSKS